MKVTLRASELEMLEEARIIDMIDERPVLRDEFVKVVVKLFREGYCSLTSIHHSLTIYAPDLVRKARRRGLSIERLISLIVLLVHLSRDRIWDEEFLRDFYEHVSIKKINPY